MANDSTLDTNSFVSCPGITYYRDTLTEKEVKQITFYKKFLTIAPSVFLLAGSFFCWILILCFKGYLFAPLFFIPLFYLCGLLYKARKLYQKANKEESIIILERFNGYGVKWQIELLRDFSLMEKLTKLSREENATPEIKAAFYEVEPVFWNQAKAATKVIKTLNGKRSTDFTSEAKETLHKNLATFMAELDKLEELLKNVNSLEVLGVNIEIETFNLDQTMKNIREIATARKELVASIDDSNEIMKEIAASYSTKKMIAL